MTTLGLILLAAASSAAAQQCYSMDGSVLDSRYKPCFPEAKSSGCCMLNGTQGGNQQNDLCLDSGLCQSTSGWYAGFLYINGCTDQTGNAEGCPKLCSFLGNQYSWSVLQCEPGKFCCRAASDNENCCGNNATMISTSHIGNLLLPGASVPINTTYNATNDAPSTASGSTSSNSTCLSASDTSANPQCAKDNSAMVGGVVGGILGAALIGALTALAFAIRSRKHYQSDLGSTQATLSSTEAHAAKEKLEFEQKLEDNRRHMQSIPPQYVNTTSGTPMIHGQPTMVGTYSPGSQARSPALELDHGRELSELGVELESRRAELMSENPKSDRK